MEKNFIKERIRYYRTCNNMSARNLSLELGMSSEYVNQVETGKLNPSLNFIINFCEYFHVSLSEFFDEKYNSPIQNNALSAALNKLSPAALNALLEFIKNCKY